MTTYSFPYPSIGGGFGRIEIDALTAEDARNKAEEMAKEGLIDDFDHDFATRVFFLTLLGADIDPRRDIADPS